MKITLIVIGKTTKRHISEAIGEYSKRIERYCRFELKTIPELKNTKSMPKEVQLLKESEALLPLLDSFREVFLLDENGKQLTSEEFARFIEQKQLHGTGSIAFVIGGPYGFAPEVRARANGLLSLSAMTFSHQLIRPIFLEQLYRAYTIINGEPYHHA